MSISLALGLMANLHTTNKLPYMLISLALGLVIDPLTYEISFHMSISLALGSVITWHCMHVQLGKS